MIFHLYYHVALEKSVDAVRPSKVTGKHSLPISPGSTSMEIVNACVKCLRIREKSI